MDHLSLCAHPRSSAISPGIGMPQRPRYGAGDVGNQCGFMDWVLFIESFELAGEIAYALSNVIAAVAEKAAVEIAPATVGMLRAAETRA